MPQNLRVLTEDQLDMACVIVDRIFYDTLSH